MRTGSNNVLRQSAVVATSQCNAETKKSLAA